MIGKNNEFEFKRQYYIKDLFHGDQVLNNFSEIEFESIEGYLIALEKKFLQNSNKAIIISIKTPAEFQIIKQIFEKTELCSMIQFRLKMTYLLLDELLDNSFFQGLEKKKFAIILTEFPGLVKIDIFKKNESALQWCQENPIWLEFNISYSNYEIQLNSIPRYYIKGGIRFIKLNFDYESFLEAKIDEFKKIEFWINHLNNWIIESRNKDSLSLNLFSVPPSTRSIFVDNNLKLFFNSNHFAKEKENALFDLLAMQSYNGESIPFKELNRLRQYLDLSPEIMICDFDKSIIKWSLVDYYQNRKIMGNVNEIPLISMIIMNWVVF